MSGASAAKVVGAPSSKLPEIDALSLPTFGSVFTRDRTSRGFGLATKSWPPPTFVHTSIASHTPSPSLSGRPVSAGQSSLTPSQVAATSRAPALGRHPAVLFASGGQLAPLPSQLSATSQAPAAARHSPLVA